MRNYPQILCINSTRDQALHYGPADDEAHIGRMITLLATDDSAIVESLLRTVGRSRVEPSVDSVGDSYDNALAETIIGLFKTEVIHHRGPWRHLEAMEYATLEWVDWFNRRRLLEPIGNLPPAELELAYHRQQSESALTA